MTIEKKSGVRRTTVGKLLAEDLRIPPYQRPYCWEPTTALQLLDDIRSAQEDSERRDVPYVLGSVIIHKEKNNPKESEILNVIDGQQRLITLHIILSIIEKTKNCEFLVSSSNAIGRVWTTLSRSINAPDEKESDNPIKQSLAEFVREKCEVIRIETDDIDEAFRVFDSQNYRGKPLAPHDLLKAYHLREMHDETSDIKEEAVKAWESAMDDDLDRLFSIYLYPIARWSRGESASGFTIHDIGMFKGISPKNNKSPNALYHIAAQTAMPLLNMSGTSFSGNENRDASRMRFQLDAPLLAGRSFFEMVAFMLTELKKLVVEAFEGREEFAFYYITEENKELKERSNRSRYRYVSELYISALLYYTNKFGDENIKVARNILFTWAYSLRVERLRVLLQSVDNFARGVQPEVSAFTLIRNSESARILSQRLVLSKPTQYNENHEKKLFDYLNQLGCYIK